MKQTALLFVVSLLCACLGATIWHVNSNPDMGADFTSLSTAVGHATVLAGDTLYVYGAPTIYADIAFNKRLTIIGPGYFLNENAGLQQNPIPAQINNITINAGGQGSVIAGLQINAQLSFNTASCVVQRCYVGRLYLQGPNCFATQCFIGTGSYDAVVVENVAINFLITNSYIYKNNSTLRTIYMHDSSSGSIVNCVLRGYQHIIRNAEFYNNIVVPLGAASLNKNANCSVHHNVFLAGTSGDWDTIVSPVDNLTNVTTPVFAGTGTTDGQWQLGAGSVAIGYGVNGVDCGIYGGQTPYKLSGIPAIPTIYEFYAPSTGFNIPIQLRARSNN
ncbi:MAG: hypothetical protein K0B87_04220 [Candidatus Syntrophosphaera sp.]|nr:hypothetical protein [Candidatus Syntrophosphaera sp.]